MKNHLLLSLAAALALTACAPASQSVKGRRDLEDVRIDVKNGPAPADVRVKQDAAPVIPEQKLNWIVQNGGQRQLEFNPQTDILFVIDNSDSMAQEQDNLSRNITRFAQDLRKNRMIDYHIGVISVWDRSARAVAKSQYQMGELRRVKNSAGIEGKARFLTRAQADDALLAPTLKIGVTPYADGGPEDEEIFAPLSAAIKKTGHADTNEGFFRENAQLVVVIVTDADDSAEKSDIDPKQMAEQLFELKGGRKDLVTVYGVLVRKGDPDAVKDWGLRVHPKYHPECFETVQTETPAKKKNAPPIKKSETRNNGTCAEGFGPERLEQFLIEANAERFRADRVSKELILSLNQGDYGKDLAKIGSDIAIRALEKTIVLEQRPRRDENGALYLAVRYGKPDQLARGQGQVLPAGPKGWTYDPETNSVRLAGDIAYQYVEGAIFEVRLVPMDLNVSAP